MRRLLMVVGAKSERLIRRKTRRVVLIPKFGLEKKNFRRALLYLNSEWITLVIVRFRMEIEGSITKLAMTGSVKGCQNNIFSDPNCNNDC